MTYQEAYEKFVSDLNAARKDGDLSRETSLITDWGAYVSSLAGKGSPVEYGVIATVAEWK